jgi:tetrahydromethanopterin S-methyltransferase subunit H
MFVFKKEQSVIDFNGITIGGQPGEHPTVLIGGLFFRDQPIVENAKEGLFDKKQTKEWIDTGVTMSEKTSHPLIIQVYGRTRKAMEQHISWLADNFDGPFMFESTGAKARARGIEYCEEAGLQDRAIYNSINLSMKDDEKEHLKASSINKAVVLGWSPKATSLPERMKVVGSMISEAESLGIKKMIVDPGALPVGAGYGLELRTTIAIKSEYGLPTCLSSDNASSAWRFLKEPGFDSDQLYLATVVASTSAAQLFATDSIMYGSMLWTKEIFTTVSLIANAMSVAVAESNQALGVDRSIFVPPSDE